MSKPKKEIDAKTYFREIHFLYEILNNLKSVEEVKVFFKDILTKSELRMLKRRWHIANLLYDGLGPRETAVQSKTSTQTVSKIKTILEEGHGGLKLAIDRVRKQMGKEREEYLKSKRSRGGSKFVKGWFK